MTLAIPIATQNRLAAIREKLDQLRTLDLDERVFGAAGSSGHHYREEETATEESLGRFERQLGGALPDELRVFLRVVHGGGPGPGYGMRVVLPVPVARASRPFACDDGGAAALLARRIREPHASLELVEESDDDDWPPGSGFLSLAHHGCGVVDVIVVTGQQRGKIWCCDMAWRPYERAGVQFGFLDWYEDWLDSNLTPRAIERLRSR